MLDAHFMAEPTSFKVLDQRAPEIPASFLTKTGNIYSCHYGTYLIENNQVIPERLEYFVHVLNKNGADALAGKTLKVEHYTLYRNTHLETLRGATFGIIGGAAGGAIASATDKTSDGIPLASVDWDTAGNSRMSYVTFRGGCVGLFRQRKCRAHLQNDDGTDLLDVCRARPPGKLEDLSGAHRHRGLPQDRKQVLVAEHLARKKGGNLHEMSLSSLKYCSSLCDQLIQFIFCGSTGDNLVG